MFLKEQNGNTLDNRPIITDDEVKFIAESCKKGDLQAILISGMLSQARSKNQTLDEVFKQAISEPGNEEHIPAVQKARVFLAENSAKFGLIISPDKPI